MKQFTLIFIVLFSCLHTFGQVEEGANKERIEAMRVGFITKRLNLTSEEAQKFWPVFNLYSAEMGKLREDSRLMKRAVKEGFATMSDKEVEQVSDEFISQKRKEWEIADKYHKEFKKVLPIRKIAALYKAERDFKLHIIKELRDRNEGGARPLAPGGGKRFGR
jgi:hypothetical protein